ncbi:MAG: DUF3748 domain-containing protein [Opitutaceae bacterium]|nr:DUF3748 domain-containing protein [Opitutaceae bacterium]
MTTAMGLTTAAGQERQLTHAPHGHVLTNVNVWSPDGQWIVYDVRSADSIFDGARIEQVNVGTGEIRRLYEAKDGARCGAATCHPADGRVVFIHGPENPTADWSYAMTRRRGALVDARRPGEVRPLDAMNYAPPFAPGALRGGSHVHVFSGDGQWVSFTYEDDVLARFAAVAPDGDPNQRNVGVAVPDGPVRVARTHPRNHDGDYFSVIVTRTVTHPRPGSDDISRAYEEGWVGRAGYARPDGTRQKRALAFLGNVTAADGREHAEVFVVDLPDDLTRTGAAPLEGTAARRPAPPQGVVQRRITFTADRAFPGVVTAPRHWLRCSPDGTSIAFLMKDDAGVVQLWSVSPNGGTPRQVTRNPTGVASTFTWSPDGRHIAHLMDGSVCVTAMVDGRTHRLTPRRTGDEAPLPHACVFAPDGKSIAYTRNVAEGASSFAQVFVVPHSFP